MPRRTGAASLQIQASPLAVALAIVLAGMNAALVAMAWQVLDAPVAAPDIQRQKWTPPALAASPPRAPPPPIQSLAQSLDRPLLFRSRRPFVAKPPPPPPTAAPTPAAAPPGPAPVARGILMARGQGRILLMSDSAPNGLWLGAGDAMDGWTVIAVDGDGAQLRRGEILVRVELYSPKPD